MQYLLFMSLAVMFWILINKELPDKATVLEYLRRLGLPLLSAVLFFIVGSVVFMGPLAGIFLAALGWIACKQLDRYISGHDAVQVKNQTKDFVSSATSLYMADNTTPEVIMNTAGDMPEPLSSELRGMLVERNLRPVTFPELFERLGEKYQVEELTGVARIIAAGEMTGGPASISAGLNRLGDAMRNKDRLRAERLRGVMEPAMGAGIAVIILIATAILDATVWRDIFMSSGIARLLLALGIAIVTGLVLMILKLLQNKDLV